MHTGENAECPNCRVFPSEKSIQEGEITKMTPQETVVEMNCPECENPLRLVYSYTGSDMFSLPGETN